MEINTFIDELLKLPEQIKDKETEYFGIVVQIDDINREMKDIERFIYGDIMNAVDKDGKLVHSNEKKREIELKQRLKLRTDYTELLEGERKAVAKKHSEQIEFDYLKRKYGAMKAISTLLVNSLD